MNQKKIPMRSCVVTHEKYPKKELIRVVKTDNGIVVDETGKVNGHGVYLKKDIAVIEKARTSKILNKLLESEVTEEVYSKLKEIIK